MKKNDSPDSNNAKGGLPIQLKLMLAVLALGIAALVLKAAGVV